MNAVLYIHEPICERALLDRHHVRTHIPGGRSIAAIEQHIRHITRLLAGMDTLLVPDDINRCDHTIERIKHIARCIGVRVAPLRAYTSRLPNINQPAAAAAEPPAQQQAACGQNTPAQP